MKRSFLAAVIIIAAGCSKTIETPEGLLSKEEMISILLEIHLQEGKVQQLRVFRDSATLIFNHFEQEIFKEHQVDDSIYYESLSFYYNHPIIMEEIYTAVVDSLSVREQLLEGKTSKEN